MRLKARLFILMIIIILGMAFSIWVGKIYFKAKWAENNSTSLPVSTVQIKGDKGFPLIGGPFHLIDQNGQSRSDADFKGKFMLVYFGYSFCPDICPAALINITEALTQLGTNAKQIQPLFITIDPERDTSAHLKLYMENYHPSFIALTGPNSQIESAKKAYRVYGIKAQPDESSTEYVMDHSSLIYVMDRQGRFVAHFNHVTPPKEIVRVLEQVIN